jgi:epoxyqueuosine reductase QueG
VNLQTFFEEEKIDIFAVAGIEDLPEPDQADVREFLPGARSVIVFGKEVPAPVYRMAAKEKTREMLRIAESLDESARKLAGQMNGEHIAARPVPLYLPVKIASGRVQGLVRLKHVAAAGGLGSPGRNTVLHTPRFGPRLLLSGVVTDLPLSSYKPEDAAGKEAGNKGSRLCTNCDLCARVCPGNAIGPGGVETFRCRTVRTWVPPLLVPSVKWLLGARRLQGIAAPLAPYIARMATIRCSLCVTECPNFAGQIGR